MIAIVESYSLQWQSKLRKAKTAIIFNFLSYSNNASR